MAEDVEKQRDTVLGGPRIQRRTVRPMHTEGVGGAVVFGGYLASHEKDSALVGQEKYRTYSDLLANISIVAAGVRYFLNLVAKANWSVEPADQEDVRAKELAKKTEKIFKETNTPWHRIVRRSAMYRFYGFSIQEWTARRREDGVLGIKDIAPRPQRTITRWDIDEQGMVRGAIQEHPQTFREIYLPRPKTVYIVDDSLNDDPEGLGLFRHIVKPAKRLQRFETLEGFGFETDLRGTPVGRAPLSALKNKVDNNEMSEEDRSKMEQPMRQFIQNHIKNPELGMLLDSTPYRGLDEAATPSRILQWDLDVIKGQGAGAGLAEIANAIERLNREIARILGVEQMLLGSGDRGSFAMAESKSENFLLIVNSTLQEIAATYDRDVIGPLWRINGWPEELKPTFKIEPISFRDASQVSTALKDLAAAGVILDPSDPAILEIFDMLGLSRPERTLADVLGEDASLEERQSIGRDIADRRQRGRERLSRERNDNNEGDE